VSEQIVNGTSAQIGYTVPLTLVHKGKYSTAENTNWTQPRKENNAKHIKTKLPWFSHLLRHSARKRARLV